MKAKILLSILVLGLAATALTSCDTATGQGAGWGAATGAVIGAAATGRWEGAATGAAIGAGTGALIGAAVDESNARRYGPPPHAGYPYGRSSGHGYYESPYPPHQIYDLRGIPHGAIVDDRVGRGYFRKP